MSTATGTATESTVTLAKVGQRAPDFDMPSTKNIETLKENVKLADYKGKWLIMFFYPLDFTGVCSSEIRHFSDRFDEVTGLGADVLGVSTDSVYSHRTWLQMPRENNGIGEIKYPIASDPGGKLAKYFRLFRRCVGGHTSARAVWGLLAFVAKAGVVRAGRRDRSRSGEYT